MCYGSILSDSLRRAAKAHRCDSCGRIIERREIHRVMSIADAGKLGSDRSCLACVAIIEAQSDDLDADGCYYGSVGHDGVKEAGGWKKIRAGIKALRERFTKRKESCRG